MKRPLYLILVAAILLSCVACGGEVASSEISEITPPISSEEVKDDISSDVATSSEPISSTEPSPKPSTSTSTPASSKQENTSSTPKPSSLPEYKTEKEYTDYDRFIIEQARNFVPLKTPITEMSFEEFNQLGFHKGVIRVLIKEEYKDKEFSVADFNCSNIKNVTFSSELCKKGKVYSVELFDTSAEAYYNTFLSLSNNDYFEYVTIDLSDIFISYD